MVYDHSRKAGNCGDVWKHAVLVALTDAIETNSDSFRYVESHAGAPLHELKDNGEWRRGVGRLAAGNASCDSRYRAIAGEWLRTRQYPAGWAFAADRLARRFEHVEVKLFDTFDHVAERYRRQSDLRVPSNVSVKFQQQDGYCAARRLEAADADFVFLDPPYSPDSSKDWRLVGEVCRTLAERKLKFAVWYPFYWPTRPAKLSNSTRCTGWEVAWAPAVPSPVRTSRAAEYWYRMTCRPSCRISRTLSTSLRPASMGSSPSGDRQAERPCLGPPRSAERH